MRILLINADFYKDISGMLQDGAKTTIKQKTNLLQELSGQDEVTIDEFYVSGALEIPPVISYAEKSTKYNYDIYIALGCVIRGETTHYDYVCEESISGLSKLMLEKDVIIGNAIITVENRQQAIARADKSLKNKGGFAVEAAIKLYEAKKKFL